MTTDQARRDRVANALLRCYGGDGFLGTTWSLKLADAAIAAMNEPEPTPQLLVDMAKAALRGHYADNSDDGWEDEGFQEAWISSARAALGVVSRWMHSEGMKVPRIAVWFGIPESMVRRMLDE